MADEGSLVDDKSMEASLWRGPAEYSASLALLNVVVVTKAL